MRRILLVLIMTLVMAASRSSTSLAATPQKR